VMVLLLHARSRSLQGLWVPRYVYCRVIQRPSFHPPNPPNPTHTHFARHSTQLWISNIPGHSHVHCACGAHGLWCFSSNLPTPPVVPGIAGSVEDPAAVAAQLNATAAADLRQQLADAFAISERTSAECASLAAQLAAACQGRDGATAAQVAARAEAEAARHELKAARQELEASLRRHDEALCVERAARESAERELQVRACVLLALWHHLRRYSRPLLLLCVKFPPKSPSAC
jgi:hypothetical protein